VVECGITAELISLHVRTRGDFIIVGDLMKSLSVYLYRPNDFVIEEIAKDPNSAWTTAVEVLDDDVYISAENNHNLYVLQRQAGAESEQDRSRLLTVGECHISTLVNRFHHGSLVMMTPELQHLGLQPHLIYGTIDGSLGVIAMIQSEELYTTLQHIQENISLHIKSLDGVSHAMFRSFSNDRRTNPMRGFIDGDLIESFLNLSSEIMQNIVDAKYGGSPLKFSVTEVVQMIEDFTRIH
jgi:DNA damage-binding protein 1